MKKSCGKPKLSATPYVMARRLCCCIITAPLVFSLFTARPWAGGRFADGGFFSSSGVQSSEAESGVSSGSTASGGDEDGSDGSSFARRPEDGLYAPDNAPMAASVCLVNEETGLSVYKKNADEQLVSGSLVKMMTCVLTMDFLRRYERDMDAETVSSADKGWIYDQLYGQNASTADIRRGETLTVRELLYAALLPSANEAALLLADYVSTGYMPNFLYQMNTRARALGCTGTVFADPNGLSEENLTTANDMIKITREFMSYPELREIAAVPSYEMAQHEQHSAAYNIFNTNRLTAKTSPYYKEYADVAPYVQAGKTGSLGEWQSFASMAAMEGETYICAVLHSPYEADTVGALIDPPQQRPALCETAALYRWAFSALTVQSALDTAQPVTELRVRYSTDSDTVLLLPQDNIKAVLPLEGEATLLTKSYTLPKTVDAPIKSGEILGSVTLSVAGQAVGVSQLAAAQEITRNPTLYLLTRLGEFFTGLYFRVLFVVTLVFAALYAGLIALAHNSRMRRKASAGGMRGPPVHVKKTVSRAGKAPAAQKNSKARKPK